MSDQSQSDNVTHGWLGRQGRRSWYLIGISGCLVLAFLVFNWARQIAVPLLLSSQLAIVFSPYVDRFTARGISRTWATVLTIFAPVLAVALSLVFVVAGIYDRRSEISDRASAGVAEVELWAEQADLGTDLPSQIRDGAVDAGSVLSSGFFSQIGSALNSVSGIAVGLLLGVIFLYYLLRDGPSFVDQITNAVPDDRRDDVEGVIESGTSSVRSYFRGTSIVAGITGAIMGVSATLLGVPMGFTIAVINFFGCYIPYLGAFVGGAFAVLLAVSVGGVQLGLAMLAIVLFTQVVVQNLIEPSLIADQMDMHPMVVLISTMLGGMLFGVAGLVIAAPLTSVALQAVKMLWSERDTTS